MLRAPSTTGIDALADWVEASLVCMGQVAELCDAELRDSLEIANIAASDEDVEKSLTDIRLKIQRRRNQIGASYPFVLDDSLVKYTRPDTCVYSFLLLASLGWRYDDLSFADGAAAEPAQIFEHITGHAICAYLGPGGQFLRFGAPREAPAPTGFADALHWLCGETLERTNNLDELVVDTEKDEGLDVVAWKPFPDNRRGHLTCVAQCAIGRAWKSKVTDLSIDRWVSLINWYRKPTLMFSVPGLVEVDPPEWAQIGSKGGIVFDRTRLAHFVNSDELPIPLKNRINAWAATRTIQVTNLLVN